MVDITSKQDSPFLHLYVSCEGDTAYEVTINQNARDVKEWKADTCHMKGYGYHHTYVYPGDDSSSVHCSCEGIAKCCSIESSSSFKRMELHSDNQLFLVDEKQNQYKIDIRDRIDDLTAFCIVDRDMQLRIVLVCRDSNKLNVYTDILQHYDLLAL